MLSARHPGLVPFLGAWSTQHFTLDKEFKALALLVINPFPCGFRCQAYILGIELCDTNLEEVLLQRKETPLARKKLGNFVVR